MMKTPSFIFLLAVGSAHATVTTHHGCKCKPESSVWITDTLTGMPSGGGVSHTGCGTGPYEQYSPAQGQPWCDVEDSYLCPDGWDFCTPGQERVAIQTASAANVHHHDHDSHHQHAHGITTSQGCTCKASSEVIFMDGGRITGGGWSHDGCAAGNYAQQSPGKGRAWCDTVESWCNGGDGWDFCSPGGGHGGGHVASHHDRGHNSHHNHGGYHGMHGGMHGGYHGHNDHYGHYGHYGHGDRYHDYHGGSSGRYPGYHDPYDYDYYPHYNSHHHGRQHSRRHHGRQHGSQHGSQHGGIDPMTLMMLSGGMGGESGDHSHLMPMMMMNGGGSMDPMTMMLMSGGLGGSSTAPSTEPASSSGGVFGNMDPMTLMMMGGGAGGMGGMGGMDPLTMMMMGGGGGGGLLGAGSLFGGGGGDEGGSAGGMLDGLLPMMMLGGGGGLFGSAVRVEQPSPGYGSNRVAAAADTDQEAQEEHTTDLPDGPPPVAGPANLKAQTGTAKAPFYRQNSQAAAHFTRG